MTAYAFASSPAGYSNVKSYIFYPYNSLLTTPKPASALDFRSILDAALRLFFPWLAAVLLLSWAGYPGVICVTPIAWVLALAAGVRIATRSRSPGKTQRLVEAALAGVLIGLLQGLLFILVVPRLGPIEANEQAFAMWISLGMLCGGVAGCRRAFNSVSLAGTKEAGLRPG
jgi:hypothetical protein